MRRLRGDDWEETVRLSLDENELTGSFDPATYSLLPDPGPWSPALCVRAMPASLRTLGPLPRESSPPRSAWSAVARQRGPRTCSRLSPTAGEASRRTWSAQPAGWAAKQGCDRWVYRHRDDQPGGPRLPKCRLRARGHLRGRPIALDPREDERSTPGRDGHVGTAGSLRRRRMIRAEFVIGAVVCTALGAFVLVTAGTVIWQPVGVWLVGADQLRSQAREARGREEASPRPRRLRRSENEPRLLGVQRICSRPTLGGFTRLTGESGEGATPDQRNTEPVTLSSAVSTDRPPWVFDLPRSASGVDIALLALRAR